MKKVFLGATLLCIVAVSAMAQTQSRSERKQAKKEEIQRLKVEFFNNKLQLSDQEASDFWPVFNQYEEEQDKLKEKYNLKNKKLELMSDAEVEDFVMGQVQMAEDQAKLRRDYVERFKQILPIRKVAMLPQVNREFKKVLLREMRQRRQGEQRKGGGRPGGPGGNR